MKQRNVLPGRATLKGDVVVTFYHVDRQIVQVRVDELNLIRSDGQSNRWHLSPEEVERTATAAGLGEPAPAFSVNTSLTLLLLAVLAALALLVVLGVVCGLITALKRPPRADNTG